MFNLQKIGGDLPPLRPPRPCHLPQPCIGIPWRHRWIQEEATMKYQKETQIFMSGIQKKYQIVIQISRSCQKVILRQKMILRQSRHQRAHPQSVMPPQSRNQCRHTVHC